MCSESAQLAQHAGVLVSDALWRPSARATPMLTGRIWGERESVEANDDFQRQFSPSCNFQKVV